MSRFALPYSSAMLCYTTIGSNAMWLNHHGWKLLKPLASANFPSL
jgi:hypothetical protein